MTPSPDVVEMVGRTGLIDYIEFVAEYGSYTLPSLDHFARALELYDMSGMTKIDRENRAFVAQRAIGSGIQNVLFSDAHDAAEAEECVAAVRAETPQTKGNYGSADRRFAGYGLESGSPEYVQALEDCVVALMIEKGEAVKNLDAMLSVPGIDMVVFGGNDYSMSIGKPHAVSPEETAEVRNYIFKTALSKGVQPRAEINHPDQAAEYVEMGVKHFAIGTDLFMIRDWLLERAGGLRGLLGL
jgi:4-hydroxy-2-oxoheptanedioate aldolase